MGDQKRLNKFIGDSGYCSRREADKLILEGKVLVNNKVCGIGTQVNLNDKVMIDGKRIVMNANKVYIAFNKPVGITCTTDLKDPHNIIDYIGHKERIFPIGRLDKDSEGLIFLTNDGDIVNAILRAGNNHEKEYIVTVDCQITDAFIKKMSQGVPVHDTVTLPCKVEKLKPNTFRIVLVQGLNRQIRLMCKFFGFNVVTLKRVRIMNVSVKGIETGSYRDLSSSELEKIFELTKNSSNTKEASKVKVSKKKKKKPYTKKGGANETLGNQPIAKKKRTPRYLQKKKKKR